MQIILVCSGGYIKIYIAGGESIAGKYCLFHLCEQ